jgi:hypothetical protein
LKYSEIALDCQHQYPRIYFERGSVDLHCDAARLLVFARVEVAHLASEFCRDDAVRGEQAVRQRRLAVVDVGQDADVADVPRRPLQAHNLRWRDHGHGKSSCCSKVQGDCPRGSNNIFVKGFAHKKSTKCTKFIYFVKYLQNYNLLEILAPLTGRP